MDSPELAPILGETLYESLYPFLNDNVIELALDLGRPIKVHTFEGFTELPELLVTHEMLEDILTHDTVGTVGPDNRAGVDDQLHRISVIRDMASEIIGLTFRFGREFPGCSKIIHDLVETGKNVLLIGIPGRGKTSLLRDLSHYLSLEQNKRVMVIDTSNEIAGSGVVPHKAIGSSRRMMVPVGLKQSTIMIEAVKNHTPQVVVIDEISNYEEAKAAVMLADRGVQLIGTAHGKSLASLLVNDPLHPLIGGVNCVTLSDDKAEKRGTTKTVNERKTMPPFEIAVEILDYNKVAIHHNVAQSIDFLLNDNGEVIPEVRELNDNEVYCVCEYYCTHSD